MSILLFFKQNSSISRLGPGLIIPGSVSFHRTTNYTMFPDNNFYFILRNFLPSLASGIGICIFLVKTAKNIKHFHTDIY